MTAYTRDEIISASDMARSFSTALSSIVECSKEKLAISKNNRLEAVLISIDEYEKLKEAYEILEYMELSQKIQERKDSKTISLEASMKRHKVVLKEEADGDLSEDKGDEATLNF